MSARVPEALRRFFAGAGRLGLAFSGGCDSAYLLYAGLACGADLRAYFVRSAFQPAFELEDAQRLARELGAPLRVIELDALADARVRANGADRCYHCKRRIFDAILRAAAADGCACVIDGTNASDDAADRPGMRALAEMKVASPLRDCGVTKAQVRTLSREAGLFTWNKPAYACLATRVPAGTAIEPEALARVEAGEGALRALGLADVRLRLTERGCRLELTEADIARLPALRNEMLRALEADFREIALDLRARKGLEI